VQFFWFKRKFNLLRAVSLTCGARKEIYASIFLKYFKFYVNTNKREIWLKNIAKERGGGAVSRASTQGSISGQKHCVVNLWKTLDSKCLRVNGNWQIYCWGVILVD